MIPKFSTSEAWRQAELLMQPAFIRLIDNIRKQLEQSTWRGSYRDVQVWPEHTSAETQARVGQLQRELEAANAEEAIAIRQALNHLPQPVPGYELCLSKGDRHITVDLWDLCYQICFRNYSAAAPAPASVEVDDALIDEQGEVDWHYLDGKAQDLVSAIFEHLPSVAEPVE